MNRIITNSDLANVDYTDLLDKILKVIENQQIFQISTDNRRVLININQVVNEVIKLNPANPLGNERSVRSATLNFSANSQDLFIERIKEITGYIQQHLTTAIQKNPANQLINRFQFIQQLLTDLQTFKGEYNKHEKTKETLLDFTYPFLPAKNLQKQRLTVKRNKNSPNKKLLKAHKVKISVDKPRDFSATLLTGINNYLDVNFADINSQDREELEDIIDNLANNPNSDIYSVQNLVNQETLGKLKKLTKIKYLEFLLENIDENASDDNFKGKIYLQDLIRRLYLLEDYINDSNKADGEYEVNYAGTLVNYQSMFSRSEAYDILPIIPNIEGFLGETEDPDKEKIEFTFGLKLKFDGKVQAYGGKTVFDYNLNLLNPEEHQQAIANDSERSGFAYKVLKIAFLYYFIFASRQDPTAVDYDPRKELEYDPLAKVNIILSTLQGNDEEAKKKLLRNLCKCFNEYKTQNKINVLKKVLINLIKRETSFIGREYPVHISVKNSILETDIDTIVERETIFKEALRKNFKDCLKYINVGNATTQTNLLITLRANINISELNFLETQEKETFNMEYDIPPGIKILPAIFLGREDKKCQDFYNKNLVHRKLLIFTHRLETPKLESHQEIIYKITYSLLAYICLHVILEKQSKIFIPLLRIHLKQKRDNDVIIEKFIVDLTKVLSHLFNDGYRSNEQGIVITASQNEIKFKIPNVLNSLYSVFPKKFQFLPTDNFEFKEIDKLAIIVVSSRESDSKWGMKDKKSNLMGEIITLQTEAKSVRFQLFKTFSENFDDHEKMFEYPTVIVDNVNKLYQKGYRHFIYIAKVPYSTTLHITQTVKDEELFFMSKNVITAFMKDKPDIKIYPMFFEKYYVVKMKNEITSTSLYIQDTLELTSVAEDKNKQSVIFFNLFNGLQVANDVNYHGVMSYATLLNMYEGILDDKDIKKDLIYDDNNDNQLKNEILQCLTLFHFSRYEKSGKIQLKLDPYQNLIGDESVSQAALFPHSRNKGNFNSLAFLTYVKGILNKDKSVGNHNV
ncbi:hypothetical protein [Dolichospermum circinale]|uniref:hypothetical protein n=1 Tax=Dolichospermum circinale TaxID=109265 RepID=UPI00232A7F75|nr:hypothetical protein [Dolichospermum circinale]MDB9467064.1 hypothetical protein [Dolichospermum circinale CS-539/09]MDB9470870.1 hypothetical protein [Dolichospermum circinale CS-539]